MKKVILVLTFTCVAAALILAFVRNAEPTVAQASITAAPAEFLAADSLIDDGQPLSAPRWLQNSATVSGIILGYKPRWRCDVRVVVDNVITGIQEAYSANVSDSGTFRLAVPLYATQGVLLSITQSPRRLMFDEHIVLSPRAGTRVCVGAKSIYFAGANAELNVQYFASGYKRYHHALQAFTALHDTLAVMSKEQYKAHLLALCAQFKSTLDANPRLTRKGREYVAICADYEMAYHLFRGERLLVNARKRKYGGNEAQYYDLLHMDSAYYSFLQTLPLNDTRSLYAGGYFLSALNACNYLEFYEGSTYMSHGNFYPLAKSLGMAAGDSIRGLLLFELIICQRICNKMREATPLSAADFAHFGMLSEPFFAQYLHAESDEMMARHDAVRKTSKARTRNVSATTDEAMFDSIFAPLRGKDAVVEFWATWCGPCRLANKKMAEVKPTLDSTQVAWVYITDESSPNSTWRRMLPAIAGEHYRLARDPLRYIKQRLAFVGNAYPSFVILNRDGVPCYFSSGFPGVEKMLEKIKHCKLQ